MYVCVYIYIYILCIYIYIYVYTHMCMYIYIYIFLFIGLTSTADLRLDHFGAQPDPTGPQPEATEHNSRPRTHARIARTVRTLLFSSMMKSLSRSHGRMDAFTHGRADNDV